VHDAFEAFSDPPKRPSQTRGLALEGPPRLEEGSGGRCWFSPTSGVRRRSTVSRRNDANHASRVSVLALRGENWISRRHHFKRSEDRNAHPGRDDSSRGVALFRAPRAPTRNFASSTSLSSDRAGSGLDSSCVLRSDRDPSRTRAPAKGRRGVERIEVLSIGGLEFAHAGRIPRLSRVGDLLDSCEPKMKPRAPFQPLGSIRCRM